MNWLETLVHLEGLKAMFTQESSLIRLATRIACMFQVEHFPPPRIWPGKDGLHFEFDLGKIKLNLQFTIGESNGNG